MTRPKKNSAANGAIVGRLARPLETSSRLFELMHGRLEAIERTLVEGQKLIIGRLDRLVAATLRERTRSSDRLSRVERRLEALEHRLSSPR